MTDTSTAKPPILIIGAGITGLILAQALNKHSIPFRIFEADEDPAASNKGWGLTIHWSLDILHSLLPQHLIDRLPETYVNPEATARGEHGNFLFFDLRSGQAKWKVPPSPRIRVARERLRRLLLTGVMVEWSKKLNAVTNGNHSSANGSITTVTAHFADSTIAQGSLIIGADGIHSRVRTALLELSNQSPSKALNTPVPVRLLGARVIYTGTLASKLRAIDPFFFQGGDPATNTFMYFSFLDTPSSYRMREGKDTSDYVCQIVISWPYRSGWLENETPTEVPNGSLERVKFMQRLAGGWAGNGWAEPFRECVMSIPESCEVKAVQLEDWQPRPGVWDNQAGTVTLMGDAAHAMTMFRGEGANHAIADVASFIEHCAPKLRDDGPLVYLHDSISAFEHEMIARTGPAVLASRQACLDAHDYESINKQSPLISKRAIVADAGSPQELGVIPEP